MLKNGNEFNNEKTPPTLTIKNTTTYSSPHQHQQLFLINSLLNNSTTQQEKKRLPSPEQNCLETKKLSLDNNKQENLIFKQFFFQQKPNLCLPINNQQQKFQQQKLQAIATIRLLQQKNNLLLNSPKILKIKSTQNEIKNKNKLLKSYLKFSIENQLKLPSKINNKNEILTQNSTLLNSILFYNYIANQQQQLQLNKDTINPLSNCKLLANYILFNKKL